MRGLDPRIFLRRHEMAGSSPAMTTYLSQIASLIFAMND